MKPDKMLEELGLAGDRPGQDLQWAYQPISKAPARGYLTINAKNSAGTVVQRTFLVSPV